MESIDGLTFAKSPDYGYVTSCPTNLGTGMRASVHIQLPNLTKDGTDAKAKAVAQPLGLSVRGTGGEHTPIGADGTVDISPSARFCITEAQIITALYKGIELLKQKEDAAGASKLLVLGLDSAGKTTLLYRLMKKAAKVQPTGTYNVETVAYGGRSFALVDVGGSQAARLEWSGHFANSNGIVFVVDCQAKDRLQEAHDELQKLLRGPQLARLPLLVFANKQDAEEAVPGVEVGICIRLL